MAKKPQPVYYTIFNTEWGCFGLAATETGLLRTVLPSSERSRRACSSRKAIKRRLLTGLDNPQFEKNLLKPLQDRIVAYFAGRLPSSAFCHLSSVPLALDHLPPFTQKVLVACKKIPPGKTISYSQLARMIGKPRASRAVGNALAKNPIPLIVPCHRVIRSDGLIGNFSAAGGTDTKKELIALESNEP